MQDKCITHSSAEGILTVRLEGRFDVESMFVYVTENQSTWAAHACILWDLREFDARDLTGDSILKVPDKFAEILQRRAGGRTAILVKEDLEVIANIAVGNNANRNSPVKLNAFCSEEEALAWLRRPSSIPSSVKLGVLQVR